MKILLDTQVFIWMFTAPERLPLDVIRMVESLELILSIATPWEMMIKFANGKLHINDSPDKIVEEYLHQGLISLLPIQLHHISMLGTLAPHYRDPFDRIIIAQALSQDIAVVSSDAVFDDYGVKRIWE